MLDWIVKYKKSYLLGDVISGLTIGTILLPQGMSYAVVAGLPPIYGLYCTMPMIVYSLFGTSKHLSVGPVALVSLLLANSFPVGSTVVEKVLIANAITFLAGVILLGLGLLQLGFVIHFVSHPVISGFTSAAAITIALTQISSCFGYEIESSEFAWELLYETFGKISQTNIATLLFSLSCLIVLFGLRHLPLHRWLHLPQLIPPTLIGSLAPLFTTILGICLNYFIELSEKFGVEQVGNIPSGIPVPTFPKLSNLTLSSYIGSTFAMIALVIAESMSIASALALRYRYNIHASQELVALGSANIIGSIFHSYVVAGSFSRSAVNAHTGANTQLASIIASFIILLSILVLMPLFTHLPKCVLSCIVIMAVSNLVDYQEALFLWRVDKLDFVVLLIAFISTLGAGSLYGLLSSVAVSLMMMLYATYRPRVQILPKSVSQRRLMNDLVSSPNSSWNDTCLEPFILCLRISENLYFGNAESFQSKIFRLLEKERRIRCIEMILIDIGGMSTIDSSALRVVRAVKEHLTLQHIELLFCQASSNIHLKFCLAGLSSHSTVHNLEDVLTEIHCSKLASNSIEKTQMLQVQVVTSEEESSDSRQASSSFHPLHFLYHDENKVVTMHSNMKRSNSAPSFSSH
ncbi:sulfate permease, SulP family [Galdieria sulphuraria]|uniref:Sulfate permease, SulP family n=1 Tax=Galdieria sulphuraria TaxID=130081 RepID=M2XJY0_GALSU|nr:sulfate permease, SulP family [Galdieria sulphuraria]EME30427.1 sulfate permease, SulP family [Galdieria sulphuraria]|eukprot:XP_005706947.1 sulfate permease, SulP family [Galdieria sulphuraria]